MLLLYFGSSPLIFFFGLGCALFFACLIFARASSSSASALANSASASSSLSRSSLGVFFHHHFNSLLMSTIF